MRDYLKRAAPAAAAQKRQVEETVRRILGEIAREGDAAVRRYARDLDGWEREELRVSPDEIGRLERRMPESFKARLPASE